MHCVPLTLDGQIPKSKEHSMQLESYWRKNSTYNFPETLK